MNVKIHTFLHYFAFVLGIVSAESFQLLLHPPHDSSNSIELAEISKIQLDDDSNQFKLTKAIKHLNLTELNDNNGYCLSLISNEHCFDCFNYFSKVNSNFINSELIINLSSNDEINSVSFFINLTDKTGINLKLLTSSNLPNVKPRQQNLQNSFKPYESKSNIKNNDDTKIDNRDDNEEFQEIVKPELKEEYQTFIRKYWMYFIPILIVIMVFSPQ